MTDHAISLPFGDAGLVTAFGTCLIAEIEERFSVGRAVESRTMTRIADVLHSLQCHRFLPT
jgi:hypothetical protein